MKVNYSSAKAVGGSNKPGIGLPPKPSTKKLPQKKDSSPFKPWQESSPSHKTNKDHGIIEKFMVNDGLIKELVFSEQDYKDE